MLAVSLGDESVPRSRVVSGHLWRSSGSVVDEPRAEKGRFHETRSGHVSPTLHKLLILPTHPLVLLPNLCSPSREFLRMERDMASAGVQVSSPRCRLAERSTHRVRHASITYFFCSLTACTEFVCLLHGVILWLDGQRHMFWSIGGALQIRNTYLVGTYPIGTCGERLNACQRVLGRMPVLRDHNLPTALNTFIDTKQKHQARARLSTPQPRRAHFGILGVRWVCGQ